MFSNLSNLKKAALFFGLVIALTLAVVLIFRRVMPQSELVILAHMLTPLLATLMMLFVVTRDGLRGNSRLPLGLTRSGRQTWGLALLLPLPILAVSYGLAWVSGAAAFVAPTASGWLPDLLISLAIPLFLPLPPEIVPLLMVFVPALLAISLTALTDGQKGLRALLKKPFQWQIGFKWYVIVFVLSFGLRLTMSVLAWLLGWIPAIQISPWSPVEFIILGVFIMIGAVAEELAWRGYVLPKLLAHRSAVFSALLIGVIWGVIHLGLILPGQMNAGSHWLPTILYIVGLSTVLTWLHVQTQGNLVIPTLFHFGQSYFVFLNGGISLNQQLWLMTAIIAAISLVLVLLFSVNLQRDSVKKPALVAE